MNSYGNWNEHLACFRGRSALLLFVNHTNDKLMQLRQLAQLLDSSVGIPGTRFRFGLDAALGLIPGIGDAAGALLATYILWQAKELGASNWTLLRMAANVGLDTLVGAVPALGDLFDAAFKANIRNIALLERDLSRHQRGDHTLVAAPSSCSLSAAH